MPASRAPTIPIVDLTPFLQNGSETAQQRKDAAAVLVESCHEHGCVGISGHGFAEDTLRGLFSQSQKLFAMPLENKMKAPHPIDSFVPHRGYTAVGGEKCFTKEEVFENKDNPDFWKSKISYTDHKESFDAGSEDNKKDYNIWYPEDMFPGFRSFTLQAFWELYAVCIRILDVLMDGLSLSETEKDDIRAKHTGLSNLLRLMHYPPLPAFAAENPLNGRMQAHTDWTTFTLLFQDSCGGLEFGDRQGPEGQFMPATPQEGVVYLNIGDMFTRMTNDYLPAALHRVAIPDKRIKHKNGEVLTPERFSIPFFFNADSHALITTPESILAAHGPRKYDPITRDAYAAERAKWLYKKS